MRVSLDKADLKHYDGLRMCELGNQWMFLDPAEKVAWRLSAKEYFKRLGVQHVSLDLNGQDDALAVDLSEALEPDLGEFDVVTNFGTAEHVSDYYQCLKNIHDLCRVGGLMVHETPLSGHWPGHGHHYALETTFKWLADKCNYDVITEYTRAAMGNYKTGMLACAALRRRQESTFPGREEFQGIPLATS